MRKNKEKKQEKELPVKELAILSFSDPVIKKNLKEIFEFYCKKSYKEEVSFEKIHCETTIMNLQKYFLFCKEFKMFNLLKRNDMAEIFKLFAIKHSFLDLETFQELILKVAKIAYVQNNTIQPDYENKICYYLYLHNIWIIRTIMHENNAERKKYHREIFK